MISFIYGEYDQSIGYIDLLKNMENDKIKVFVEKGQDHHLVRVRKAFKKYLKNIYLKLIIKDNLNCDIIKL